MKLVGQALPRREDARFLTGSGNFVDDVKVPNTAWVAFLRSPHAHARIKKILTADAAAIPGVLRVLTAADWKAAGLGEMVCVHPMPFSDGRPMNGEVRRCFTGDKVRHVGDVVAAVVAEDRFTALDAVEAIDVDYEILPSVTSTARALDADAPLVHERFGANLVNEIVRGNQAATEAAFAGAAHVTELTFSINRLAANPIEPRSYLAQFDAASGRTTLWATAQIPHYLRRWLSVYAKLMPEHKLRVISPDVGGGFGAKGPWAVEVATVVWAAQLLGRPVKWTCTRSELLLSDAQARDHFTRARMAFSASGQILAMHVETLANQGGYLSNFGPSISGNSYPQTITGLYTTPTLHLRVRGVYTNTLPVDAYRGSGRPEATLVNERLLDNAAREMGIDVVEMRRRNLIPRERFPYTTPVGRVYDNGDPPAMLQKLLTLSKYENLRQEQERRRANGELVGLGLAAFLDKSGTGNSANLASRGGLHGGFESALVRAHSDGKVTVYSGSHSHGQGHDTAFCQVAADRLQLPLEDISLVQGDTDTVPFGNGTWGSRSLSVGGTAIYKAADRVIDKAKKIAAHMLECAEGDLHYAGGRFTIGGTNRSVTFAEVADNAYHGANLPPDVEPGLEATVYYDPKDNNDPQAMHLVMVSIDAQTGRVALEKYWTVDDCGVIVNPLIVEGQVQGGLAQGIGQAMMEHVIYDDDSGQLLTGSLMDYALPRSSDMPPLESAFLCTPAPSNPLGVKGGSETGTIGAPAAIGNAIVDALWHLGVRHIDPPYTSHAVWKALQKSGTDHVLRRGIKENVVCP
jgi:carbon-monoxide dehydrogenase large subunit